MKQLPYTLFVGWLPNKLLVLLLILVPLGTLVNVFFPDPIPFVDETLLSLWSWSLVKEAARRMKRRLQEVMVNSPGYSGPERRRFPRNPEPPPWDGAERRRAERVRIEIPVHLVDDPVLPPGSNEIDAT